MRSLKLKSASIPSTMFHDSFPESSDLDKANSFNDHFHSRPQLSDTIFSNNHYTTFSNITIYRSMDIEVWISTL